MSEIVEDAQADLDRAVREASGMATNGEPLAFLLSLNALVAAAEENDDPVQGAGLPSFVSHRQNYVTTDCILP